MRYKKLLEFLADYAQHTFYLEDLPEAVKCYVSVSHHSLLLKSEWFKISINVNKEYLPPTTFEDLIWMREYLNTYIEVEPDDDGKSEEVQWAKELNRLLKDKNKIYIQDNSDVEYDGTYLYQKDIGKVKMSEEEFLSRCKHAYKMI